MTNIEKLKYALFSEAKESCDLTKNEKDTERRHANAMARPILNSISKEKLIEYIIALRWQLTARDEIIEEAKDKIADLALKYLEYKIRLNKILGKGVISNDENWDRFIVRDIIFSIFSVKVV